MIDEIKGVLDQYAGKTREGIEALATRLDQIETKMNRPGFNVGTAGGTMDRAAFLASGEGKAFAHFLRTGRADPEHAKAWNTGEPSGAYAVPQILAADIARQAVSVSRVRALARVVSAATADYKHLVSPMNAVANWTTENGTRDETGTPDLKVVAPPGGELYAYLKASNWQINDSAFDVGTFFTEAAGLQFGRAEGAAFVAGDGVSKPRGFTNYPTAATADATRAFGTLQHIPTGVSGGYHATAPADVLFDCVAALRSEYRPNATWMMNSVTLATIRKWKTTGSGDYVVRDGLTNREPAQLLGYPVEVCEDMPGASAGALTIAFGDFRSGYLVLDVGPLTVVTDQVTSPGHTKWYLARRTYGALLDSNAIKVVKLATS